MSPPHISSQSSDCNKRIRQACDACHGAKTRCCGSKPCIRCQRMGTSCVYSVSNRAGRPKGTKNKKRKNDPAVPEQSPSLPLNDHDGSYSERTIQLSQFDDTMFALPELASSSSMSSRSSWSGLSTPPSKLPSLNLPLDSCLGSIPFDFNPHHDFSFDVDGFEDPVTTYQNSYNFPTMENMFCGPSTDTYCFPTVKQSYLPALALPQQDTGSYKSPVKPENLVTDMVPDQWSEPLIKSISNQEQLPFRTRGNNSISHARPELPRSYSQPMNDPIHTMTTETDLLNMEVPSLLTSTRRNVVSTHRCQCLHRDSKLLAYLQELLKTLRDLPIDVILNGVEQGLKSWHAYLQCRVCRQDQTREVLLISTVSIRAVTRLLQETRRRIISPSPVVGVMVNNGIQDLSNGGELQSNQDHVEFSFGSYEIKGEEKSLVLGALVSRMLKRIEVVLQAYKQSLPQIGSGDSDDPDSDVNTVYIHKVIEGLEKSMRALDL